MTVMTMTGAASDGEIDWHSIDWAQAHRTVRRLQRRIAKATREGRWGKVTPWSPSPAAGTSPKGRLVYVSGKLQTRKWRKDGEDSDRLAKCSRNFARVSFKSTISPVSISTQCSWNTPCSTASHRPNVPATSKTQDTLPYEIITL